MSNVDFRMSNKAVRIRNERKWGKVPVNDECRLPIVEVMKEGCEVP